jgi:FixJ family two-component response regulator
MRSLLTTVAELMRALKRGSSRLTIVSALASDTDRSLVADLSRRNQWKVYSVADASEAVARVDRERPHIVLYDRDLSDADWRGVTAALGGAAPNACVVLISRVADDYLWNEVVRSGGYDVLTKPLREDEVVRAVRLAWSYWKTAAQVSMK